VIRLIVAGVALTLLAAAPLAAAALHNPYVLSLATRAAILGVAAVSLQLIVGYGGLVSFGHAAFLGIGAYAVPMLAAVGLDDAVVSLPVAMAAAGGFALATGWVALRTSGVTFIMITLAFAQMAYFIAQSLAAFGGDDGTPLDRTPPVFGSPVLEYRPAFHLVALAVLVGLVLMVRALGASRFGRALRAARQSEARVVTSGIDVRLVRLIAYALAGASGGIAGWLLAVHSDFVSPALLEWRNSGELLVMVILGGLTPEGAALGAVALVLLQEALAGLTDHWRLILGPAIVLFVLLRGRLWRTA
jgi:branched-chain amino acid transport system permease protein